MQFLIFLVSFISAIIFAVIAFRASRARNQFIKVWGIALSTFFLVLVAASVIQNLYRLIQFNLPRTNPALTSHISGSFPIGNFVLSFAENGQTPALLVRHATEPKRLLSSIPNVAFVGAATGQANISEFGIPEGSFSVKDKIISSCAAQTLDTIEVSNTGLVLHGTLTGQGCTVNYPLTFTPIAANQLQFKLQLEGAGAAAINRIYLHGASEADEHFFGFGGQLTDFDQN